MLVPAINSVIKMIMALDAVASLVRRHATMPTKGRAIRCVKTAAEYRAMAEECFQWASETHDRAVRASYLGLAQVWLDAAAKLDGLPANRIAPEGKAHPDAPATEQQEDVA
jgi:hypothetical protein